MSWKIYVALQIGKKSLSNEIRFRAVYISCIECKCDLIIPEENDNEITRWAETEFLPCPQAIVKKLMAAPLAPKTPSLTFRPSEFLSSNQLMKQALLNSARQKILERLENDFFPDLVTPVVALRAEKDPEFPQESKTNTEISAALFAPENLVKTEDHIDDLSSDQQKTFLQSTKVTPVQDFDYGDCFQLRQSQFLDNICTPITQFSEPSQKLKTKEERNLNRNKFELNPADFVDFDDFGTDLKSKISSLLFEDETTSDFWNRNRLPNLDKEFTEKRKLMMNQPMPALGIFDSQAPCQKRRSVAVAAKESPLDEGYSDSPVSVKTPLVKADKLNWVDSIEQKMKRKVPFISPDAGYVTPKKAKAASAVAPCSSKSTSVDQTVTLERAETRVDNMELGSSNVQGVNLGTWKETQMPGCPPIHGIHCSGYGINMNMMTPTSSQMGNMMSTPLTLFYPQVQGGFPVPQCMCCSMGAPGQAMNPFYQSPFTCNQPHPADQPYQVPFVELSESGSYRKRRHGMQKSDSPSHRLELED